MSDLYVMSNGERLPWDEAMKAIGIKGDGALSDNVDDVKQSAIDSLFSPLETDDVNHPSHYNQYSFAVIDIIDEVAPTYPVEIIAEMANVIKYTLRAPHKGQLKKDLGKIIWYTQRAIDNLEKSEKYDYED